MFYVTLPSYRFHKTLNHILSVFAIILKMVQNLILGVDIGGSHVTAAVVDLGANAVLSHTLTRLELNSKADLDHILDVWTNAIAQTCAKMTSVPSYLGISMPGPLDYEKGICMINGQDKYDALFGLNIKELLAKRLDMDVANIGFVNDAVAFLAGEILGGAAKMGKNVIGLTLGTGLGSAKALKNEAVSDADLWKMPFKDAIAEEYLSTRWFVKHYFEKTAKKIDNVKDLSILAQNGDTAALAVFEEFGTNLGLFLQRFIELEGDVDTVVLGGNIAKTIHFFKDQVFDVLGDGKVEINQAILAEDAALIGAAGLWKKETFKETV